MTQRQKPGEIQKKENYGHNSFSFPVRIGLQQIKKRQILWWFGQIDCSAVRIHADTPQDSKHGGIITKKPG